MILDLIALDNSAKVWIYQADREFSYEELDEIRPMIFDFLDQWTSHQNMLMTYGNVFHRRFLAMFVDESLAGASGCSIDASVRFVKQLESHFGVSLMGRDTVAYMIDEEISTLPLNELGSAVIDGRLQADTFVFDNLVKNKDAFLKEWCKPMNESWHKRFV